MKQPALVLLLVATMAAAGCVNPLAATSGGAPSANARDMLANPPGAAVEPSGRVVEFNLYLHRMTHELYPGASMPMWGFSLDEDPSTATVPGPELRVKEGDKVVVRFRSLVPVFQHTIHWHGQHVPWDQDGVPYVSQDPVAAGEEFTYEFIAKPSGTYWYHCHVDTQHHVDMGMYGALIVEPRDPASDPAFSREYTLFLDEMDRFHTESGQAPGTSAPPPGSTPTDYEAYLKQQADEAATRTQPATGATTGTPARPARDWYPVTYPPYKVNLNTFLINGHAFPATHPLEVREGETVRLRLINAGDEVHAMHLHGHHFLVTHKDGPALMHPYWADTLLIAPGERYDVYVVANNPGVWDLHDHMGQNVQNDRIHPGGMMTMLVYEKFKDRVTHGGHTGHSQRFPLSPHYESGAFVEWYRVLA